MGQIASNGFNNLPYFSRTPPVSTPKVQPPTPKHAPYNASKTYVSLIIGDGDNLNFIKGSRRDWMTDRLQRCAADGGADCFPLGWTMSPHTMTYAPDMFEWYRNATLATNKDWFVLPPSGHLYAYPAMLPSADQTAFVQQTEADCTLMNTSGVVTWEFTGTWESAITHVYPQYTPTPGGEPRALFAVNVPYMLPVLPFGLTQQYKLLGPEKKVVLFRPREWRGGDGSGAQEKTAAQMAAELNGDRRGSVVAIYTTSDGGLHPTLLYDMVKMLGPHVEVVPPQTLAALAVQRG